MGTCWVGTQLFFFLFGPGVGEGPKDRQWPAAKGNSTLVACCRMWFRQAE